MAQGEFLQPPLLYGADSQLPPLILDPEGAAVDTCSRLQKRVWGKVKWFQMEVEGNGIKKVFV